MKTVGEFDATVKEAIASSKTAFKNIDDILASGEVTQGNRNPQGPMSKAEDLIISIARVAEMQGWGSKNPGMRVTNDDGSLKKRTLRCTSSTLLKSINRGCKRWLTQ
jgi:hypothetical protein